MENAEASSHKIRVLFPYIGDSVGGAQVSGLALIENLDPEKFDTAIVLHEDGPFSEYLIDRGVEFRKLPLRTYLGRRSGMINHLLALIATVPVLTMYLFRNKIEIVHAQDGRTNLTWMIPAKLAGVPFIWHQRSKFSRSRLSALWARLATQIISISEYTFSTLPDRLKIQSSIIENPVELKGPMPNRQNSRVRLGAELKIDPEPVIVGFFGNLTNQKQPGTFIRIAAKFSAIEGPPPVFVLFGADRDGLKPSLLDLVRSLRLEDRVVFADFVKDPERWMAGCDIVVAPGVDDAFGRTVVEAMLVGTPVVASDSGGHKNILRDGETGYLISPGDVEAFAAAIRKILRDELASEMISRNAAMDAASRFSTRSHVLEVSKIYRAAVSLKAHRQ